MGIQARSYGKIAQGSESRRVGPGGAAASLLAISALLWGCGDGSTGPSDPAEELTVRQTSAHGIFFHSPGDPVNVEAQEAYYVWLFDRLNVEPAQPLVYFKYRDRAQLERLTGEDTNGWAELGTYRFHSIWSMDNHEAVHALVSSEWNAAPALMNEGIAVAHQALPHLEIFEPVWSGTPIDAIAARVQREGRMPSLESLLESRDFRLYETDFIYPIAGSFVKSVIERHGYEGVEAFFRISDFQDSGADLRAKFREAFGEGIEDAWQEWLVGM